VEKHFILVIGETVKPWYVEAQTVYMVDLRTTEPWPPNLWAASSSPILDAFVRSETDFSLVWVCRAGPWLGIL